jgi:hypothetical protein
MRNQKSRFFRDFPSLFPLALYSFDTVLLEDSQNRRYNRTNMKIYFTAALSQRDQYSKYYERIIAHLEKLGHTVYHHDISNIAVEKIRTEDDATKVEHYKKVNKFIAQSDIVVVEASFPSTLNIGHEITLGLERGKPVIVLYKVGKSSTFFGGLNSDKLLLAQYNDENLEVVIDEYANFAKNTSDTRFNFFISPRHISYLDWIAKSRRIPRSVYLRELIDQDKVQNAKYLSV